MAATVLLLASLALQGQPRDGASYSIRVEDPASTFVEVEASLPASPTLRTSDYGAWSQPRGWATFVSDLEVAAAKSVVAARADGRHAWRLEPPPAERIQLRYRVDLAHARAPDWPDGPRTTSAWRQAAATFVLMGALLVHGEGESAVELRFHLPDGWRVAAPWREVEPGRFLVESVAKATRNVCVLGVFDERRFAVDGLTGKVVSLDAAPDVAEELASLAASCLQSYRKLFGTRLEGEFLAVTYVDRWETAEAYEDSFVLASLRPLAADSRAVWGQTVAHELFHRWLGHRMRAETWSDAQWFSEGATEYVASLALVRAGRMSVAEFLDRLEKHASFYRLHWKGPPHSGVDLVRAGREKSVNNAALYDGGCLVAFALDVELQEATDGRKGLEDLLRALHALCEETGAAYTLTDLFALASDVAGKDLEPFFARHVRSTEPLDLEALFARAGFSLVLRAEQAHARVATAAGEREERIRARILHGRFDALAEERSRRVDELVRAVLPARGPGLALTVVHDGETVHSRGYGLANLETRAPMEPTTRLHAASVAKQFTAYAIHLLQAEGRLSLEDPVVKHLPEMEGFGAVRIRHLLEHSSGIRDQWQLLGLSGVRTDGDLITQADVLRLLARQTGTGFEPGTRQSYCNSGYTLLAEIVARVSGLTFREFTAQRIFRPLGMERTCFADDVHEVFADRAASYDVVPGGFRADPLNFGTVGATSLLTTSEDLATWGADLAAFRVVRVELLDTMLRVGRLPDGTAMDFVNGLHAGEVEGRASLGHPGADAGFRSAVLVVPEERLALAVLGNFDTLDTWGLPERVAAVYLSERRAPPPAAAPEASVQAAPSPVEPFERDLAELEGTYLSLELGAVYELGVEDGRLRARHARNGTLDLVPVSADRFSCDRWYLRDVRFVRDAAQRVIGFDASSPRCEGTRFDRLPR